MKENAEGTYKTKHAEAARLNYTTTTHRHTQTQTHLVYPKAGKILRKIGRGGDPGVAAWAEEAERGFVYRGGRFAFVCTN